MNRAIYRDGALRRPVDLQDNEVADGNVVERGEASPDPDATIRKRADGGNGSCGFCSGIE